ncbi:MAG: Ig-like domain-containing protein, partial [Anaerolineae bacterium]|nr:Ig-like domain-containing protein [Thermoflexales bacterium]MDW8408448.1 Ig-like domain-containing protein [Anaerolineae bacterium]
KTAPKLLVEIPEPTMNGSRVRLTGQTEPGATVTANGVVLAVEATGHFSGEIETPSDKLVQIVAQDPAGNESVLTQVIDR